LMTLLHLALRETGLKVTETPEILFARLDFEKDLKEKVEANSGSSEEG